MPLGIDRFKESKILKYCLKATKAVNAQKGLRWIDTSGRYHSEVIIYSRCMSVRIILGTISDVQPLRFKSPSAGVGVSSCATYLLRTGGSSH